MSIIRHLDARTWRAAAARHRERVLDLVHGSVDIDARHPVFNFLFVYYSFERETLLRFSPGMNAVCLGVGVDEHDLWQGRGWAASDCGGSGAMDPRLYKPSMRRAARTAAEVMRNTSQRPPHYNCFGLHEWAMLYAPPTHADSEPLRHQSLPLRVEQHTLNSVVESNQLACTHFDAFRFFQPAAVPLNTVRDPVPSRATQPLLEQPGCVHASMDLFRYSLKLWPFVPSTLLADSLELAIAARVVDMRASPYDLREFDGQGFDLSPITVETADGRKQYQREQAALHLRAVPIRARLLLEYEAAISVWAHDEASDFGDRKKSRTVTAAV